MKKTKKLIAFVLSFVMIFSMISMPISSAFEESGNVVSDVVSAMGEVIEAKLSGGFNYVEKVIILVKYIIAFIAYLYDLFFNGLSEDSEDPEDSISDDIGDTDTDGDGVPDYLEEYYGTDIDSADTDGDGLEDYIELYIIYTDPLLVDSDDNGIDDGDEDYDKDGLSNLEELALGTELDDDDSDNDSLSDYDELYVYYTEPTNYDTDSDGVGDGQEIYLGTDPLTFDDSFEITAVSSEDDSVKASVDIELSGEQVGTLTVEQNDNETFFPEEMPGYLGSAYDFNVDGEFEEATISFEFDSSLVGSEDFDPVIYYFNEDEQTLEALDTTVEGNVANATTTHFSTYILVNRTVYLDSFSWTDTWSTNNYEGVEIVLVIDDSGSMDSNDSSYLRLSVAQDLVNNLPANSEIGIVRFTSSSTILSYLTDDKDIANSYLTTSYFNSSGGTYMYRGITSGLSLYSSSEDDNILKVMVVLSDGSTSDSSSYSTVLDRANAANVKIYTVGLGSFESNLETLASQTGGMFYETSDADGLTEIYADISAKIDIETDTDSDGIPDYYEDNLVLFNGVTLTLDKENEDSDGDGILDGEEVELIFEYNEDSTQVKVTGKLNSHPLAADSDYDGISDDEDYAPFNNDFDGVLTYKDMNDEFVSINVEFEVDYTWFFEDNTVYNDDLSVFSSLLSNNMYDDNYVSIELGSTCVNTTDTPTEILEFFGLDDVECIDLNDIDYNGLDTDDVTEFAIGHKAVEYDGETKEVIILAIRGTNGTIEEWSSNFDIGADTNGYYESTGTEHPDWTNLKNHKGFDVTATRVLEWFETYMQTYNLYACENTSILVTGHSRGAAIANILGAYFEDDDNFDSYIYTFATPNTTTSDSVNDYHTIFNIVNEDDLIPYMPLNEWGFYKYGITKSISVEDYYEDSTPFINDVDTFEWLFSMDYDNDGGTQRTINAISEITDSREDLYEFDNTSDGYSTETAWLSTTISDFTSDARILQFCTYEVTYGYLYNEIDIHYKPAFLLQTLANMTCGVGPMLGWDVSGKYADAKASFVTSSGEIPCSGKLGGMEHPHMPATYYLISHNKVQELS